MNWFDLVVRRVAMIALVHSTTARSVQLRKDCLAGYFLPPLRGELLSPGLRGRAKQLHPNSRKSNLNRNFIHGSQQRSSVAAHRECPATLERNTLDHVWHR